MLHAPLLAAAEHGLFERCTVDVHTYEGSGRAIAALRSGEVDVAVSGAAVTVSARTAGAPLVPLAPFFQRAMTVLYTTEDVFGEPLESVQQVRGRQVGLPKGSEMGILGRLLLSQSGLLDDVELVDVAGEEREALRSGRADVVTGAFNDPKEIDDANVHVLSLADHFPLYGPTFVTTERVIRERTPVLTSLLAGVLHGQERTITDPESAVGAVRTATDASEDTATVADLTAAIDRFGGSTAVRDHGWGWHRADDWRRLTTALRQAELVGARA